MKYYLIQKDDVKSKMWAEHFPKECELVFQSGSPIRAPAFLFKCILKKGRPVGYIVRYLNDYKFLPKTLLRLLSECLLVSLCYVLRIKIYWINHNVDRETIRNYPFISELRRALFARVSNKIFVTDEMLVPFAKQMFPDHQDKIRSISFGITPINKHCDVSAVSLAKRHIAQHKSTALKKGLKPAVLFCAGSPGNSKYLHFELVICLLEKSLEQGFYIIPVLAGEFNRTERGKRLLSQYQFYNQILTFDRFTRFSPAFVSDYVDFYWRVYDDWSIPFSVYEAVTFCKPTLTQEYGFLPDLLSSEGVGFVIKNDWSNLDLGLQFIAEPPQRDAYTRFLEVRGWDMLSHRLLADEEGDGGT